MGDVAHVYNDSASKRGEKKKQVSVGSHTPDRMVPPLLLGFLTWLSEFVQNHFLHIHHLKILITVFFPFHCFVFLFHVVILKDDRGHFSKHCRVPGAPWILVTLAL